MFLAFKSIWYCIISKIHVARKLTRVLSETLKTLMYGAFFIILMNTIICRLYLWMIGVH